MDLDQIVLSNCPLTKHVKNHNGHTHELSGISVNVSHELAAHVALRRILDVLVVLCEEWIDHASDILIAFGKTARSIHAVVRLETT